GACVACTSDSQCTGGQKCSSNGTCVTPACTTQANCSVGQECKNGGTANAYCTACGQGSLTSSFCRQGSSQGSNTTAECSRDTDCSYGYRCSGGKCVRCTSSSSCNCQSGWHYEASRYECVPADYGRSCSSYTQCTRGCKPNYDSSGNWLPQGSTCW
ncbi:MAG: hypothetical protein ACI4PW_08990, partial [Alphaproteobacteria bacterium]